MKFLCDVKELNEAIVLAIKAISTRTTMPILEGIHIDTFQDHVKLTTTDLQKAIEAEIPAFVEEQGSAVIPGRLFYECIRKLPEGQVSIETVNKTLTIDMDHTDTSMQMYNAEEFPKIFEVDDAPPIHIASNLLKYMISHTVFAVSTDESRPILTGVLAIFGKETLKMVALDGYRLAICEKITSPREGEVSAVIPGSALSELGRILEDSEETILLTITASHFMAERKGFRFITRLLEGEYIKYEQIIPNSWQSRVRVSRNLLNSALDRASTIARSERNNLVRMNCSDRAVNITSNSDIGKAFETIPCEMEGEDMDIAFNARYLMDVVRSIDDEEIYLCFTTNISPCVIQPISGNEYIYLVLPVRVYVQ